MLETIRNKLKALQQHDNAPIWKIQVMTFFEPLNLIAQLEPGAPNSYPAKIQLHQKKMIVIVG